MSFVWIIIAAVAGYLLGSVSFAVLVARSRGVNIFKEGSGNPGATNVIRVLGKPAGYLVFVLDFFKGLIGAGWPTVAASMNLLPPEAGVVWMGIAGLAGAVAGHSFSIFLRFRGGKGVATTIGGLMALMPLVTLAGMVVWLLIYKITRYVALASIVMALALGPIALAMHRPMELVGLCGVLAILIVIRHRANIGRLVAGTEHRFEKKK